METVGFYCRLKEFAVERTTRPDITQLACPVGFSPFRDFPGPLPVDVADSRSHAPRSSFTPGELGPRNPKFETTPGSGTRRKKRSRGSGSRERKVERTERNESNKLAEPWETYEAPRPSLPLRGHSERLFTSLHGQSRRTFARPRNNFFVRCNRRRSVLNRGRIFYRNEVEPRPPKLDGKYSTRGGTKETRKFETNRSSRPLP